MNDFITDMLQRRHELKRFPQKSQVLSEVLKLILNGFYGYCSLEATNYPKTTVVTSDYLYENKRKQREIFEDSLECAISLDCVGVLSRSKKAKRKREKAARTRDDFVVLNSSSSSSSSPEEEEEEDEDEPGPSSRRSKYRKRRKRSFPNLVYTATRRKPKTKIENTSQNSAQILSISRVVFFLLHLGILTFLDPLRVQICYVDTDSIMLLCRYSDLKRLVKPQYKRYKRKILKALFSNPKAEKEQAGLLKIEGCFSGALFRTSKCYRLWNRQEIQTRIKGISRYCISNG